MESCGAAERRPLIKKIHHPITGKVIDLGRTEMFTFSTQLHEELLRRRKVALRLGELADSGKWIIRERATKALLGGKLTASELAETDVEYEVRQKGIDARMCIDIVSIAYKRIADRIILMTGDADFVPAAKLARCEGLDVILDPLWAPISPSFNEHIDGLKTPWPKPKSDDLPCSQAA